MRPAPDDPDGTPIIGATRFPNLFLNTGHGTLGWTMSISSGRLIADIVSGRPTEIASADLAHARYLDKIGPEPKPALPEQRAA